MPQSTDASRQEVLRAIAGGATRVREIVAETELSRGTVDARLEELKAAGDVAIDVRRGRTGSQIKLLRGQAWLVKQGVETRVSRDISTPLPVAAVWVKVGLADQPHAASQLRAAGAEAVFGCTGDFDVLALYSSSDAHAALEMARDLAGRLTFESVHYGMIVGRDE